MSPDGLFSAVFYNGVGAPISVVGVGAADAVDKSMGCWSNKTVDVPAGASFEVTIGGCGIRPAGSEYTVHVKIDYAFEENGSIKRRSQMGELGGIVD
ncbi:MAG: hypothetical protein V1875_08890 [Candidatus Altiarchaeota archaeon]